MSGEENTKDFMDFINNISQIDNTEKKQKKKMRVWNPILLKVMIV